jgi:hypothetical protein
MIFFKAFHDYSAKGRARGRWRVTLPGVYNFGFMALQRQSQILLLA